MKKLVLVFFVMLGLTFSVAQAQQLSDDTELDTLLLLTAPCANSQDMRDLLREEYTEIPVAGGIGTVRLPNGEFVTTNIRIYISSITYEFTFLIEFADDVSCILARGYEFGPIVQDRGI